MWVKTTDGELVNLDIVLRVDVDTAGQVFADLGRGDYPPVRLAGAGSMKLAAEILASLWAEMRCGVRYLDMADIAFEPYHGKEGSDA